MAEPREQARRLQWRTNAHETWRSWLLSLCALGLILTVANAVSDLTIAGSLGLSGVSTPIAFTDRLVVQPGQAAAESGIRSGDMLDSGWLSPRVRYRIYDGPRASESRSSCRSFATAFNATSWSWRAARPGELDRLAILSRGDFGSRCVAR